MLLSIGWFPLILALISGPAFAPVTPSPMPTHQASAAKPGLLLAHAWVPVHLTAPLGARTSTTGQHFNFLVARDVRVGGVVVIPRCTRGDGTVSLAGRHSINGRDLHLRFDGLHPADGTTIALDPTEVHVAGKDATVLTDRILFVYVAVDTYPPAVLPSPCP